MAEQVRMKAEKRTVMGKGVRKLRRDGVLPGNIISSKGREPVAVQVDLHEFDRMLKTHGRTTLYRLVISPNGGETTVLVRHIDREPASGAMQHVDFMHVEMNKPIHAKIPIHLTGESPAVKNLDGVLLHLVDAVEVEALPGDLPDALDLDVSGLEEFNSALLVSDIKLSKGLTLLTAEDERVVTVTPPRVAEPEPEVETPAAEGAEAGAAEEQAAEGESSES
jgi:large subunit ribosomal protein L25